MRLSPLPDSRFCATFPVKHAYSAIVCRGQYNSLQCTSSACSVAAVTLCSFKQLAFGSLMTKSGTTLLFTNNQEGTLEASWKHSKKDESICRVLYSPSFFNDAIFTTLLILTMSSSSCSLAIVASSWPLPHLATVQNFPVEESWSPIRNTDIIPPVHRNVEKWSRENVQCIAVLLYMYIHVYVHIGYFVSIIRICT